MHPAVEMRIDKILGQPERVPDVYLRYTLQEALQKGLRALALMPWLLGSLLAGNNRESEQRRR